MYTDVCAFAHTNTLFMCYCIFIIFIQYGYTKKLNAAKALNELLLHVNNCYTYTISMPIHKIFTHGQ